MGAEHARQKASPLTRERFETDAFYKSYINGYNSANGIQVLAAKLASSGFFINPSKVGGSGLTFGRRPL